MDTLKKAMRLVFPHAWSVVLAAVFCLIIPTLLVATHINKNSELSPIDEGAHYDYIVRISSGEIPRFGEAMQQETLKTIACNGVALHDFITPRCDSSTFVPRDFGGGLSYEAQQAPAYYGITAVARWVPEKVLGFDGFVAARSVGVLWIVSALLVFWATGRVLGFNPLLIASGCLLISAAPLSIYVSSNVTNDASGLFSGSILLLISALSLKYQRRWFPYLFFVVGLILPLFKVTNLIAIAIIAIVLLIWNLGKVNRWESQKQRLVSALRPWSATGGLLILGGALSSLVWSALEMSRSIADPKTISTFNVLRGTPVGLSKIASESLQMLGPLTNSYSALLSNNGTHIVGNLTAINFLTISTFCLYGLLLAAGFSILFLSPRKLLSWLAFVSVCGLFLGGFVFGVVNWRTYDIDPSITARYGIAVGSFLVLSVIGLLRGKWSKIGVWALGISGALLDFWIMLG
jgi:hypothetical protein